MAKRDVLALLPEGLFGRLIRAGIGELPFREATAAIGIQFPLANLGERSSLASALREAAAAGRVLDAASAAGRLRGDAFASEPGQVSNVAPGERYAIELESTIFGPGGREHRGPSVTLYAGSIAEVREQLASLDEVFGSSFAGNYPEAVERLGIGAAGVAENIDIEIRGAWRD